MSARLLAYGGTRFAERMRIGTWPDISAGVLGDSYGLLPPAYSFGVGVLASTPFLIIRNRQNLESRGGYPFTLLLDPGEAVWQRYDWNAARMIVEVLEGPSADLLLERTEECTPELLDRLFMGPGDQKSARANTKRHLELEHLLAASIWSTKAKIFAPSELKLARRPEPAWMATAIEQCAPAFRIGAGWLIGGGSAHAAALGVRLILDDQEENSAHGGGESSAQVPRIIKALQLIQQSDRTRDILACYLQAPFWLWPDTPAKVENAACFLAALLDTQDLDVATYEQVRTYSKTDLFAEAIADVAMMTALRSGGEMHSGRALLILESALAGKIQLRSEAATQLGESFLLGELPRRGYPPKPLPSDIVLPTKILFRLWRDFLNQTTDSQPRFLQQALDQLPELQDSEVDALVDIAIERTKQNLSQWKQMVQHRQVGERIRQRLKAHVLRPFQQGWQGFDAQSYLLFADDDGMEKLAREVDALPDLVQKRDIARRCVTDWMEMRSSHRTEVEHCLQRLASSSFRSHIPLILKTKIADDDEVSGQATGPWRCFQVVERLFRGGDGHCAVAVSKRELAFLEQELQELFDAGNGAELPRLKGLKKCLGAFPEAILQRIRAFELPGDDCAKRERWEKELRSIQLNDEADQERLSLVLDFPDRPLNSNKRFPDDALKKKLHDIFFSVTGPRATQEQIRNFLRTTKAGNSQSMLAFLAEYLKRSTRSEQVACRWLNEPMLPEILLELLPDESELIAAILFQAGERFDKAFAHQLMDAMRTADGTISGLLLCVAKYLVSAGGRSKRELWVRQLAGNRENAFSTKLQDLIKRSASS